MLTNDIEKRLEILEWISAADFRSRHEAVSKERVEMSGLWFLQSDSYQNWLNGASSNLLCYQGIGKPILISVNDFVAGAGKTYLT